MSYVFSNDVIHEYLVDHKMDEYIELDQRGREWVVNHLTQQQQNELLVVQAKAEILRLNDMLSQVNQLEDSCLIELMLFDLGLTRYNTNCIDVWVDLRKKPAESLDELDQQLDLSYRVYIERQNIQATVNEEAIETKEAVQAIQ